jgi:hypothetical protein
MRAAASIADWNPLPPGYSPIRLGRNNQMDYDEHYYRGRLHPNENSYYYATLHLSPLTLRLDGATRINLKPCHRYAGGGPAAIAARPSQSPQWVQSRRRDEPLSQLPSSRLCAISSLADLEPSSIMERLNEASVLSITRYRRTRNHVGDGIVGRGTTIAVR